MFKFLKKAAPFFVSTLFLIIFVAPLFVQGQTSSGSTSNNPTSSGTTGNSQGSPTIIEIKNPFKCSGTECSIPGLIRAIVEKILMPIGGVVAVLMIMYAGFLYVTARGDASQVKKAHEALLYAVIGAAILLGALVISQAIGNTIDQLKR